MRRPRHVIFATLALLQSERHAASHTHDLSPWATQDGWRLNSTYQRTLTLTCHDRESQISVEYRSDGAYRIAFNNETYVARCEAADDGSITAVINDQRLHATVIREKTKFHVFLDGQPFIFTWHDPLDVSLDDAARDSSLLAPMPGRVIAQVVSAGEPVEKGAPLLILEAMKMECTIYAPAAGRVASFHFAVGDQVTEGAELLHFDREPSAKDAG